MKYYPSSLLESASWYSLSDNYVEKSKWYLPRLSDPSILLPEESKDGKWHLFSHTWLGIHHYTSESGLDWHIEGSPVFIRAHSPFIYMEGDMYYMLFERHALNWNKKDVTKNSSKICIASSKDLYKWNEEKVILDSSSISESSYRMGPSRLARPELIKWDGRYILYFGSGEAKMFDTRQKTSVRLMAAESDALEGPYRIYKKTVLDIEPDSPYRSLAAGAVRIYPCSDAVIALECAYVYDKTKNRSRSLMLLLKSEDAFNFKTLSVIQRQSEEGFASRAITSADLKYMESDGTWYCYYSANNKEKGYPFIREALGLLLGKSEVKDVKLQRG